jgi:hypothetical protein
MEQAMNDLSGLTTDPNEPTREVTATVIAVIPEFHQAALRDDAGWLYALTEKTPRVRLADVREGQRYHCTVTVRLPRIFRATLIVEEPQA